ncbi:MAG: carboxypeptidase-like regulatory domain-containing protein [Planctomycetota bacterium]
MRALLILGLLGAVGLLVWFGQGEETDRVSRDAEQTERAATDRPPPQEETEVAPEGFTFTGIVVNTEKQPLADVVVAYEETTSRTGDDGRFEIVLDASGWVPLRLSHVRYRAQQVWAQEGEEQTYVLRRGAPLTVLVLDDERKPVAGAKVSANDKRRRGMAGIWSWSEVEQIGFEQTAADGRVQVGVAPEGAIELRVEHNRFATHVSTVRIPGVDPVEHVVVLNQGGIVEGMVLDVEGQPVPGALVRAGDRTGSSDSAGRFRVERIGAGFVTVMAGKEGHAPGFFGHALGWGRPVPVEIIPGEVTQLSEIRLGKASYLTGVITDTKGNPLEGVEVHLNTRTVFALESRYETDAEGRFRLGPFRVGRRGHANYHVRAEGYRDNSSRFVNVKEGETADAGTIELAASARLKGRCIDEDGRPVAGAHVETRPGYRHATTDRDGRFEILDVSLGMIMVHATQYRGDGLRSEPKLCDVTAGAVLDDIELVLVGGGKISGRVLTPGGKPRPQLAVAARLLGLPEGSRPIVDYAGTNDAGRFEFRSLAPGEYEVGLHDGRRGWGGVHFKKGVRTRVVEVGATDVDFVYDFEGGVVTARVLSDRSGEPLDNFAFGIISYRGFLPTDADLGSLANVGGKFRYEFESDGKFAVEFKAPGHAPFRTPKFDLKKGDEKDLGVIRLGGGGRIEGRVVDAQGAPVPFTRINILSPKFETNEEEPYTGRDGAFAVEDVTPGMYIVFAISPEHPIGMTKNVFVQPGKTAKVEVRFPESGPLEVIVTGDDGRPLKGAKLFWSFPEIAPLTTKAVQHKIPPGYGDNVADGAGRIRQNSLPAGPVSLLVEANGFTPVTRSLRITPGKTARLEISMTRKK